MSESTQVDLTNYESNDLLVFTDAAANKVKNLIEEEKNDSLMLRVFVSGGGCSGFQYGFTFDENTQDGDTKVEKKWCYTFGWPNEFSVFNWRWNRL